MPEGLYPVLAFDKGLIAQLVFVLFALLAWILREAAERKAAKQAEDDPTDEVAARVKAMARARRLQHPEAYEPERYPSKPAGDRVDDEETDELEYAAYAELQGAPTPPPIPQAPEPAAAPADPSRPIGGLKPTFVPKDLGTMESHPDMVATRRTGPSPARERLGIPPGAGRRAVRRAVLWAEVLGPPRALTGPHRAPITKRRG